MPTFVEPKTDKRVPGIVPRPITPTELTNITNPFVNAIGNSPFDKFKKAFKTGSTFKIPMPGEGLPRVIHYIADQSGCAFWRMIWPGDELLANNKAVVMSLYQMVNLPEFYLGITAVRLQRQCTPHQRDFIARLRKISEAMKEQIGKGFKIIYEIDDICFPKECIPNYNVCRDAFDNDEISEMLQEIIPMTDEMVVVSETMADHYRKHLNFDRISVIPNYAPKYWLDRGYNEYDRITNYRNHKKKPRILYAGSGTHFDVQNRTNQVDDFDHVVNFIGQDLAVHKKYEWVFLGGLPLKLQQFIGKGVEFHPWTAITEYPELIKKINPNIMIAPLADNIFNRAKANIKLTEGAAFGIPVVAQNLDCYNKDGEWKWLFNDAREMKSHIDQIMASERTYKDAMQFSREYAEKYWMKDHMDEWLLIYETPYGDPKRKQNPHFARYNKEQCK